MVAVKRSLRYLKGTIDCGLWYPYNNDFNLKVFIDVDWAGNVDDWKSTTGGVFFLSGRLVSWMSKKQSCISQSTTEAEYVSAFMNFTQTIWMKHVLSGFKVPVSEPVSIFFDNTSAINISKNLVFHARTKHFELKYHFLREKVHNKEVVLEHVSNKEQLADIFTKPLPKATFTYLRGEGVALSRGELKVCAPHRSGIALSKKFGIDVLKDATPQGEQHSRSWMFVPPLWHYCQSKRRCEAEKISVVLKTYHMEEDVEISLCITINAKGGDCWHMCRV